MLFFCLLLRGFNKTFTAQGVGASATWRVVAFSHDERRVAGVWWIWIARGWWWAVCAACLCVAKTSRIYRPLLICIVTVSPVRRRGDGALQLLVILDLIKDHNQSECRQLTFSLKMLSLIHFDSGQTNKSHARRYLFRIILWRNSEVSTTLCERTLSRRILMLSVFLQSV